MLPPSLFRFWISPAANSYSLRTDIRLMPDVMLTDWLYRKTWNKHTNGLFLSVVIYEESLWYVTPVLWIDDDVV